MPESVINNNPIQQVVVREEKSFVKGDTYKSISTFFQTPIYQKVQQANLPYRIDAWLRKLCKYAFLKRLEYYQ